MSVALPAVQLIGTGISAYSQIKAGKTEEAFAERNAEIIGRNAQVKQQIAEENLSRGRDNKHRSLASLNAQQAGSGVGGKSFDSVESEVNYRREIELQDLYYQNTIEQLNLEDQQTLTRRGGNESARAGLFNATGTLFSGLSRSEGTYYSLRPVGTAGASGTTLR